MIGKRIEMTPGVAPATNVRLGRIVGFKEGAGYIAAVNSDAGWEFTPHEMVFVSVPLESGETGWWVREGEFTILEDKSAS